MTVESGGSYDDALIDAADESGIQWSIRVESGAGRRLPVIQVSKSAGQNLDTYLDQRRHVARA